MSRPYLFLAAFFVLVGTGRSTTAAAAGLDDGAERFLSAVAAVENAPAGVRGARGETGPWQLMPGTRRDREHDLRRAGVPAPDEYALALAHLAWLVAELERRGVPALPFNLALAWNCGAAATAAGRAPERSYDYARRVCAVMEAHP